MNYKDAIIQGNSQIINPILNSGADPNVQGEDGYTPLMWASLSGQLYIALDLLRAGADHTLTNKEGKKHQT